jgi:hypothetical protein
MDRPNRIRLRENAMKMLVMMIALSAGGIVPAKVKPAATLAFHRIAMPFTAIAAAPQVRVFNVAGRVIGLNSTDRAADLMSVTLGTKDNIHIRPAIPVHSDGTFEYTGVDPGEYVAILVYTNMPNMPFWDELNSIVAAEFEVQRSDLKDVTLVIPQATMISGHFVLEGQGPLPRLSFWFPLNPVRADPYSFVIPVTSEARISSEYGLEVYPSPDGTFQVVILDGEQRVGNPVRLPPGYSVKSLTYGTTDILTNPFNVDRAALKEFVITVTTADQVSAPATGK